MKKIIIGLVAAGLLIWYFSVNQHILTNVGVRFSSHTQTQTPKTLKKEQEKSIAVLATGLDTPWSLAFLPASPQGGPDGNLLVTERPGRVRFISSDGKLDQNPILEISQVREIGEGGLLGITLDPRFSQNNFIYLYYTYSGNNSQTFNRVVRMVYKNKQLTDEKIIVDQIPGAPNHNGGRIKFGPDGNLYIGTGDAQDSSQAQNIKSFAGKILRVKDGKAEVYSYGHRNVQGLTWDSNGQLFATEHGRSGVQSGLDELNKIEQGKNYGWPVIQGDEKKAGMETPIINSGPNVTWAPSGLVYLNGSFFFGGLRGQGLYEVDEKTWTVKKHLENEFGRIRDVVVGPDTMLYITTSNQDGRGNPVAEDDRVIRVDPKNLN